MRRKRKVRNGPLSFCVILVGWLLKVWCSRAQPRVERELHTLALKWYKLFGQYSRH